MIGEIERWVNARDDSRFLLLLDEADGFLAADALTDFRESTRLKGLMDRTERRFKVVLAGLHNVLRATERSNHPAGTLWRTDPRWPDVDKWRMGPGTQTST